MTILQLTWSLVAGGAETYAYRVARGLGERGHRTAICAIDQGGALEAEIKQSGIPCMVMDREPGIDLHLFWRLWRLFRAVRPDVVHTHHFNQLLYGAVAARLAGARLIHTEHSVSLYRKRRFRIALRILSMLCHRITAIGLDGARVLVNDVGIPARKLKVVQCGVEIEEPLRSPAESRAELGLDDDDRIALIVARLYPEKNHRLLLEAFSTVVRRVERARLLVVGEGTERRNIEAEIDRFGLHDRVHLLGVRRDVSTLLAASDVAVLSSDREGLPIAVLEAMAASRPVVATAVGDLPRLVDEGETGRLVPPGDVEALAAALSDLLSDRVEARRMGARGRNLVEQKFAVSEMIDEYEAVYRTNQLTRE